MICRAMQLALTFTAVVVLVTGCGERTEISQAPGCAPTSTPSGKNEKVPDSIKQSSCWGIVLMCNYCEYKPDGAFSNAGSHPCGVCIGFDF